MHTCRFLFPGRRVCCGPYSTGLVEGILSPFVISLVGYSVGVGRLSLFGTGFQRDTSGSPGPQSHFSGPFRYKKAYTTYKLVVFDFWFLFLRKQCNTSRIGMNDEFHEPTKFTTFAQINLNAWVYLEDDRAEIRWKVTYNDQSMNIGLSTHDMYVHALNNVCFAWRLRSGMPSSVSRQYQQQQRS